MPIIPRAKNSGSNDPGSTGNTGNTSGADTYILVLEIALPIVVVLAIFSLLYRWEKSRHPTEHIPRSGPARREYDKWVKKLEPEISLREKQEQDQSRGRNVWFSRHIKQGSWKHWIIIIDNVKYELRQNHETRGFYVNIAPYLIDHERRKTAREETYFPEYDDYHVCLIGWTKMKPTELETSAREVGEGWDYNKITNNCQHYLKLLADKILVEEKAADYPWFQENTRTEYLNSRAPPPSPEALRARNYIYFQNNMWNQMHVQNLAMVQVVGVGGQGC